MRLITIRRNFTEGECHPFFLWGDWHTGNRACAKGELHRDRDVIASEPLALYVNTGDNGDFIARDDRRFKAEHLDPDIMSLDDLDRLADVQVEWLEDFERPVIDKCVAQVNSNHPGKYDRIHHTNTMRLKLKAIGGRDLERRLWCPAGAVIRVVYTDAHKHTCEVVLNVHHGNKTSKDPEVLLKHYRAKLQYWPDVDVLARGHCHWLRHTSLRPMHVSWSRSDNGRSRLVERPHYAVLTGGYLKTFVEDGSNYAEDVDLDPIDIGVARLNVWPSRYGAKIEVVTR